MVISDMSIRDRVRCRSKLSTVNLRSGMTLAMTGPLLQLDAHARPPRGGYHLYLSFHIPLVISPLHYVSFLSVPTVLGAV